MSIVRRSSAAAARPLRTAPSIVSGQPVSVHAPASTRPGRAVAAFGRSAPLPGVWRNVARRSRVTKNSVTSGVARGREELGQRGHELLLQLGHWRVRVLVRGRQRDGQVLLARPVHPGDAGPVEDPLHRGVDGGHERQVHDRPVVDHVHVDDGRRAQAGPARDGLLGQRARRDQRRGLLVRDGQDHRVGGDRLALRQRDAVAAAGAGSMAGNLGAQHDPAAELGQQGRARVAVQFAQRQRGDADVGRVVLAEQAGLDHHGGQRQRGVVAGDVQRRDGEQVPQRPAGPLALPPPGEPVAEALRVRRRVGRVDEAHRQRGASHRGPFGTR